MSNHCTIDEVKGELNITDTAKDTMLQNMVEQASAFIDIIGDRDFGQVSETRYFDGGATVFIDDLAATPSSIKLDEDGDGVYQSTLTGGDYHLYPLNAYPKRQLKLSDNSNFGGFASGVAKGVEVTGTWGYPTTSKTVKAIKRAAIIQVCRWFKRKDSAFQDVSGNPETGQITVYKGLDPDIREIIMGSRRFGL